MIHRARCVLLMLAGAALAWPAATPAALADTNHVSVLQTHFDHETNSVHKAKLFEKLGDEEFFDARHASQARDYKTVDEIMEHYRDNARAAFDALRKEHPNAEKQLSGYKQLQIHIHRGIREVDESLVVAPAEFRPPLLLVRQDLSSMDDELLVLIFPRRTNEKRPAVPPSTLLMPDAPENNVGARPDAKSDGALETSTEPRFEQAPDAEAQPGVPPEEKPVEKSEMPDMNIKNCLVLAALTCAMGTNCGGAPLQPQQKDYLSPLESDKIRDAETTNDRIKLFLTFADDRLKKFQYELEHPSSNKHPEMLNGLMNGYVGCVDDATDLMQLGVEKQENVLLGIDLIATRAKEFLDVLNKMAEEKVEIDVYKDNLNDAIEGTRDAMNDAEKAKKTVAPPPVRRKS
jgi:hypothetical protein